jgi:hypothetical protein
MGRRAGRAGPFIDFVFEAKNRREEGRDDDKRPRPAHEERERKI